MTIIKQYNPGTSTWDTILVGEQGPPGADGADGVDGADGATGATGPAGADGADGADGATGPAGPTGATGPQGDEGPAGGALLAAFWTYNATTSTPPAVNQIRTDAGLTNLYVNETDADGFSRIAGLGSLATGMSIMVRAANGTAANWTISGTPTDNGSWWTIPFTVDAGSGTVTKGARTQLNFLIAPLTETSGDARYAKLHQSINAQTGTTYTLVLGDDGKLVTLSNASGITLTVPPNSSVAAAIGAKIDIAQIGAGQVTVAAGSGVTVNATPGLKLRAQYSAGSLIQRATDIWLLVGDLSA